MPKSATIKSLQAYNLIRELILQGELLPGSRLILADLESRLNVGRGPIREALMRLDRTGLINNLPYKGAIVAPLPTLREIQYIYDLRVHLESILAVEAMNLAGKKEYDKLEGIIRNMEDPTNNNSLFFHPDREFHDTMYKMANMPHLRNTASRLVDQVEIFLNSRYYGIQDQKILIGQHKEIFQAFCDKDEERLCESLKKNILIGLELIHQEMKQRGKAF